MKRRRCFSPSSLPMEADKASKMPQTECTKNSRLLHSVLRQRLKLNNGKERGGAGMVWRGGRKGEVCHCQRKRPGLWSYRPWKDWFLKDQINDLLSLVQEQIKRHGYVIYPCWIQESQQMVPNVLTSSTMAPQYLYRIPSKCLRKSPKENTTMKHALEYVCCFFFLLFFVFKFPQTSCGFERQ